MNNQNLLHPQYSSKNHSEIVPSERLKPITQLLKESWGIYCLQIKTFLGIIGLPIGFSFFFWALNYFLVGTEIRYSIWFSIIGMISFLGSFFLWLWAIPSLLYTLKENTNIKESYEKGFKILLSYIWVYFLWLVIIVGGFLAFIIPGILFSLWLSLAIFVLIFEERKGVNALFRSKHLIKGSLRKGLGRFLVLGLIMGMGLFPVFALFLFGIEDIPIEIQTNRMIGYSLQLLVLPFFLIYGSLIYKNLKEIKAEIPYERPKISNKIKYLAPELALGILIIGWWISIPFLNIWSRDIPPLDDSDLWLTKVEIPKEENAFHYLYQTGQELYLPPEKMEIFEKWDSELAKRLIKNNKEVFPYFKKATKLPYFQIPGLQDPKNVGFETLLPGLGKARNIARLNSIKANYLLRQGEEREALSLTLKIIEMGQMLQDGPRAVWMNYLVGLAIKEIGFHRLRAMIADLTLSPEILKDYLVKLDQFEANEEGLIRAMKMEYIMFANLKTKEEWGKLKVEKEEIPRWIRVPLSKFDWLYKPNQTQGLLAESFRSFINKVKKDYYYEMRPTDEFLVSGFFCEERDLIQLAFIENMIGKILHDMMIPAFDRALEFKHLEDFSVRGTQLLLALRAHQIETGKLPFSLAELVPRYLSEIPRDPFDGELIRYCLEKGIIYSVGKDLKDSGGSEGEDWARMQDPTFRIEF